MSLLDRLFPAPGVTVQLSSSNGIWSSLLSFAKSASGITVTTDTAMRQATVYACIRVLSETMAQLPLQVYQRMPGGSRRRANDHPLEAVLGGQPNGVQTSFEFREMMQGHMALRGNAYAQIIAGELGSVTQLLPLHPGRVEVKRLTNGKLRYEVTTDNGGKEYLAQDQVFHLRNMTQDGINGLSPITFARDSIGLTLAAERYGSKFFANGVRPSGMLTSKTANLTIDQAQKAQQTLMESQAGEANWQKPIVMWGNLEWQNIGMTNEDARFIETLDRGDKQICQIFRIQQHMVGILDRSTNNNIEQQSLEFVLYTMLPWVRRWEEAISRDLLNDPSYYVRFNLSGLLRGDANTRSAFYSTMVTNGLLCPNEVRELEDRDPYEGGDEFFMQGAMVPVEKLLNPPEPPAGPTPDQQQQQSDQAQMQAQRIGELNGELEVYRLQMNEQRQEIASAARKIAASDQQIAGLNDELAKCSSEVERLRVDGERSSYELESARKAEAMLSMDLSAALRQRDEYVSDLNMLRTQLESLETAAAADRQRLAELEEVASTAGTCLESALDYNSQIMSGLLGRLLTMESEHAMRAVRKPNFLSSIDQFYEQHYVRMLEAVEPIIQQRNALSGSQIDAAAFVRVCQEQSKQSLLAACECQPDELETSVSNCVATWEGRIDELLNHLNPTEANDADSQGNS